MQEAKSSSLGDNEFINQLLEFEEGSRKTERKFEEINTQDCESKEQISKIIKDIKQFEPKFDRLFENLNEIFNSRVKR